MEKNTEQEILWELQCLNQQVKELDKKIGIINSKVNRTNRQTGTLWEKFKRRLKKEAKKPTAIGWMLKKLINVYRRSWRYMYCLLARRKGVQKNKIVFISHRGKQYSCNPMYISKYLMKHYPGRFEIVWAFDAPDDFSYLKRKGIKVVQKESREHLTHLMTAKVIVTNVDFYIYLPKVKGQIALDTWHGGGSYKTCGFANAQNLMTNRQKRYFKKLYSKVNLYCSSSKAFTQQTIRESRLFQGEVLEVGMPRNDILVKGNKPRIEEKVRKHFSLAADTKIVLYAPTYRSEAEMTHIPKLDVERLNKVLSERFGGKWCCLYRAHHLGSPTEMEDEVSSGMILPAVKYPDMQELLYAADVLVSDYSSCIWDFSLQYKPVFLFCPDLDKYTSSRDFYMPIENWHFVLTRNQAELEEKIQNFDEAEYRKGIELHHQELGSCESGQATKVICQRIFDECFPKEDKKE